MVIPTSCKDIVNRERLNEICEPHLEGKSLNQQVHYLTGSCSYLLNVIIALVQLVRELESGSSQTPSGTPGA